MNPAVINAIAEIVGPAIGMIVFGAFGLACFPSIRAALADHIRQRTLRHGDAVDVVAHLNALRGEVHALRVELAQVSHTVGAGAPPQGGAVLPPAPDRALSGTRPPA